MEVLVEGVVVEFDALAGAVGPQRLVHAGGAVCILLDDVLLEVQLLAGQGGCFRVGVCG